MIIIKHINYKNKLIFCIKDRWGHLAGSVSTACNCLSWGCKFEPHVVYKDYLKKKKMKKDR